MPNGPILIIAGTNRPNSNAMRVARVLEDRYRQRQAAVDLLNLQDLPHEVFEPSIYFDKPPSMVRLQERVLAASGLHVVTPEYNGSFPGVLKYFIDLLKFPESFEHKPVAYVGESSGVWGGLRAVEQLQMVFGYRHAHSYPVRVFMPAVNKLFAADGTLNDAGTLKRLDDQVGGFLAYISLIRP